MAYTTINKYTDYFNSKLYTGNGGTQAVTGVGFQPDWVWLKGRSYVDGHVAYDALRGTNYIQPNTTGGDSSIATGLASLDSDGFTLGSWSNINRNNETHVSWNWKANGAGSSNTDGDVTSTVSANTTAGFSIVKWTGSGSGSIGVGHGLGATPKVVILKNLDGSSIDWHVYNTMVDGSLDILYLNTTGAKADSSAALPNSSVFNTISVTNSANNYIAYCFAEKKGYSKFGKYTGNGSTDGTFVFTGFKPTFLLTKRVANTGNWHMYDAKRDPHNGVTNELRSNTTDAETDVFAAVSEYRADFLSNGFKIMTTGSSMNTANETYIYMAFGQSIVGTNNTPCTAR